MAGILLLGSLVSAGPKTPKIKTSNEKSKMKESLQTIAKVVRQADAVTREMWWVIAADRKPAQRSPFGKVERALLFEVGQKLTKSTGFRCDNYQIKRPEAWMYPYGIQVLESCVVKNPQLIAEVNIESEGQLSISFFPENLTEILGLQASVVNKKATCQLWYQRNGVLSKMRCKNWTQDRNDKELVDLDVFNYQSEGPALMEVKGNILEDMNPVKKIQSTIPLDGPILVKEVEIPDPVTPHPPPPVLTPKQKIAPIPRRQRPVAPVEALPDPDYISAEEPADEGVQPPPKNPNYVR